MKRRGVLLDVEDIRTDTLPIDNRSPRRIHGRAAVYFEGSGELCVTGAMSCGSGNSRALCGMRPLMVFDGRRA
jgi:hypothetical protein